MTSFRKPIKEPSCQSLDAGFFYGSEMEEGEETKETRRLVVQISPRMQASGRRMC